jgi:hypothetical protein
MTNDNELRYAAAQQMAGAIYHIVQTATVENLDDIDEAKEMLRDVREVAVQILDLDNEDPIIVAAKLVIPNHVEGHPDDDDPDDDDLF